jgi:uncharacterized protein (UPF0212 family)
MDCRVVVEAAVPVYDVETADEAVRIAISKTGGMLNPDLSYVEIDVGSRTSPSGEPLEPAFIVADEALVALELTMTVFNVEREEHASRIARKEIGQRMENIPLDVLEVSVLEGKDEDGTDSSGEAPTEPGEKSAPDTDGAAGSGSGAENGESGDHDADERPANGTEEETSDERTDAGGDREGDDDILPEFEDLIDE